MLMAQRATYRLRSGTLQEFDISVGAISRKCTALRHGQIWRDTDGDLTQVVGVAEEKV